MPTLARMNTASRIRLLRIKSGKSEIEMAVGINLAWYCDLERYDDELTSTLTIAQALHPFIAARSHVA